jgi:hypothetical protein
MNRSNLYNVVHLSLSFFLIFMSYNVAQTFQTSSDNAKDGAFAVGIIYLVFCCANLALSSFVVRVIGVRLTLIISSVSYGLFIASNIQHNRWALFVSSFLLGLGAALLWIGQSVYVAMSTIEYEQVNDQPASSAAGFVNGLFFGLFQLNQTAGNLLAACLFRLQFEQWIVFSVMTVIAACGTVSLIFLRSVNTPSDSSKFDCRFVRFHCLDHCFLHL